MSALILPPNMADRFWRHVDRSDPDGCWTWQRARDAHGYGRLRVGGRAGRVLIAHRVAYTLAVGPADGFMVRHRCDNPPCCRPDHLELGTQADNVRDMDLRGRRGIGWTQGEGRYNARLTDDAVRAIRAARAEGSATYKELAARFGVSKQAVASVATGRSWRHVS